MFGFFLVFFSADILKALAEQEKLAELLWDHFEALHKPPHMYTAWSNIHYSAAAADAPTVAYGSHPTGTLANVSAVLRAPGMSESGKWIFCFTLGFRDSHLSCTFYYCCCLNVSERI